MIRPISRKQSLNILGKRRNTIRSFHCHSPIEAIKTRITRLFGRERSLTHRVMGRTPKAPGVPTRGNRFLLSSGPLCPGVNDGTPVVQPTMSPLPVLSEETDMGYADLLRLPLDASQRYCRRRVVDSAACVYPRILRRSNMTLTTWLRNSCTLLHLQFVSTRAVRITPTLCVSLTTANPFVLLHQYCRLL